MRDPARIPRLLTALYIYWERNPELRLAQIIGNVSGLNDPYYYEDDALIAELEAANDRAL